MSLRPQHSKSTEESDKSDTKNRKGETQAGHQMEKTEEKFSTKSTVRNAIPSYNTIFVRKK